MSNNYHRQPRGRIHAGERDDDNNEEEKNESPSYQIQPGHFSRIANTAKHAVKESTRRDYRSRLCRMVDWCVKEYPEFAASHIRPITEEEKNDVTRNYFNQTHDFIYNTLKPGIGIIKAFLTTIQTENQDGTGKTRSYSHIRKFHDAILFGAGEQRTILQREYHQEMRSYLHSFDKETTLAKRKGNTEEIDADPLNFELYRKLCTWAVDSSDMFAWVYFVLLWNCMGRSASVDALGLHNLKLGVDSIVITYDDSKMDSTGKHVHPKNCYANPYEPQMSSFLVLAIWCFLYPDQFEEKDLFFIPSVDQLGNATKRFATHLKKHVAAHYEEVKTWGVPSRIKPHSCRKGTATHLTSGTLNPPALSSVSHRAEWSQGKVQDIYYNFALPGDHYVGRILAGLDPNSTNFRVLPPHFTCGLENEYVREGIDLCHRKILKSRKNLDFLPGIFLIFLASIVYHEAWLKKFCLSIKKHAFSNLFILENANLLQNLKNLVTTAPTDNMSRPTGIPTHINLEEKMDKILNNNIDFLDQLKLQTTVIREAVKQAIQQNDLVSGNVTMPILTEKLDNLQASIIDFIETNIGNINNNNNNNNNDNDFNINNEPDELLFVDELQKGSNKSVNPLYCYRGRFWDVPKGFTFPKNPTRKVGWEFWLRGKSGNEVLVDGIKKSAPIKPFRKLESSGLPPSEKGSYTSHWAPIYEYMEETPGLNIPPNPKDITAQFINESFDKATEYMKNKVSYIWTLKNRDHANWSISTWSKYVSPGYVNKLGTDEDKLHVPLNYRYLRRNKKSKPSKSQLLKNNPIFPVRITTIDSDSSDSSSDDDHDKKNDKKRKNVSDGDEINDDNNKDNNDKYKNNIDNKRNKVSKSNPKAKKRTKQQQQQQQQLPARHRQTTICTAPTPNSFAAAFTPNTTFMDQARESSNSESEIVLPDVQVQQMQQQTDRLLMNSTDPSLLVRVPTYTDRQQVANASRTTMASFTATITTMLEAAAASKEDTSASTGGGTTVDKNKE